MLNTQNSQTNTARTSSVAVKVDPTIKRLRIARIILYIGIALWLSGFIIEFAIWLPDKNTNPSPFNVTNGIVFAFSIVLSLVLQLTVARFWGHLNQRRQRAAAGDRGLLAHQQPVPNANALALPLTIGQRPKWSTFLIFFGIMFVTTIIVTIVVFAFAPHIVPSTPHPRPLPPFFVWVFVAFAAFFLLVYGGIFFVIFYYKVRQQVTITQDGLMQMNMFHRTHSVAWRDAKLFAINGIYGSFGYKQPAVYELSSEHDIIRWSWIRHNNARVVFLAKPTAPPAEYERQMQGLLSIIAARTNLPLCDLRKKS